MTSARVSQQTYNRQVLVHTENPDRRRICRNSILDCHVRHFSFEKTRNLKSEFYRDILKMRSECLLPIVLCHPVHKTNIHCLKKHVIADDHQAE